MFCCVYFQKADRKNLIWQIIKDYSTAILVANYAIIKRSHFFISEPLHRKSCVRAWGIKIKSCRNSISWKLNYFDYIGMKKGVKCAVRLDQ